MLPSASDPQVSVQPHHTSDLLHRAQNLSGGPFPVGLQDAIVSGGILEGESHNLLRDILETRTALSRNRHSVDGFCLTGYTGSKHVPY